MLFDLDGMLTDPKVGITKSVAYALERFHIHVEDLDTLISFIGPPLQDSFQERYHLSETDTKLAIQYYREYFSKQGMFENEVYPGIIEMLIALRANDMQCYVATSKPEEFAVKILNHFALLPYFEGVCGATMDGTRSKKGDVIAYALQTYDIDASMALMIGDRKHDIIGAKEHGLKNIGVLYGYGSKQELEAAGADAIVMTPQEVQAVCLSDGRDCYVNQK